MIVRAIDGSGDWLFGKGRNDYLSGNAAIGQNIRTRLLSFVGDCFFDTQAGIDWFNLLASGNQLAMTLAVSAVILNTDGVTQLLQLSVGVDAETRAATIQYQVTTTYSRYSSTVTVNVPSGVSQ